MSISQIRALDDFVYLSGHQSGHKIVLIYPAETMNSAASNALLKKLEEPPEQVLFILVSHRSHRCCFDGQKSLPADCHACPIRKRHWHGCSNR
ncbi:MAG: hypothetical protein KIS65_05345 [Nitrosomonas sp.]|nr:hypothetical protein [Nitrosomonas sp.]